MDMSYIMKYDYIIKYNDTDVIEFNPHRREAKVLNSELIPFCIQNNCINYNSIEKFCADRILMYNREHCKEILLSCGIDDQSPVNICIVTNGLSFFDHYWICKARESKIKKWEHINLFTNPFSIEISNVALSGKVSKITDKIFTGELSTKGTRPKGIFRENDGIYIYKNETKDEIASEILSNYIIASLNNIDFAEYSYANKLGRECSKCKIKTDLKTELLSARNIMSHYNEYQSTIDSNTYKTFMAYGGIQFVLMQLFDYMTLNIDRNRDNYGIELIYGNKNRMFPLFDHDSCFKGKKTNAIYFPTSLTFNDTLSCLKDIIRRQKDNEIMNCINNCYNVVSHNEFKQLFLRYKDTDTYNGLVKRIQNIMVVN